VLAVRKVRHLPRAIVGLSLLALLALATARGVVGVADVLCLAPALLVGLTLLVRRYPGERLLLRLVARRRRPAHRRLAVGSPRPRASERRSPHGGLLIGLALAVRPPPVASIAPAL
jgi:hypothetical protein